MDFRRAALACLGLALLSCLVWAPAPAYDPWSWLLWGREVAGGTLSTAEGPAFKPLPVAATAPLSLLGDDIAPVAWVVLARAAAFLAVALAYVVASTAVRRGQTPHSNGETTSTVKGRGQTPSFNVVTPTVKGRGQTPSFNVVTPTLRGRGLAPVVAGGLAAVGVALCGAFPTYAVTGDVTGLLLVFALGGALAWQGGRLRLALLLGVGAALLRVEAWPFLAVACVLALRKDPAVRPAVVAAALVPLAWFVPEWLGSGDLLRSGDRARIPNPGQPAEADVPFLASLADAVALPLVPLLVAAAFALRSWLVATGAAWVLLVAVMAEAGFSGEARYAVPGAALIVIGGATALARLPRLALAAAALIVAAFAVPPVVDLADLRSLQAHQWDLKQDLPDAIDRAGGRDPVLACGTPYVGRLRGPILAYALDVEKQDVEPDDPPRPPGTVFASRRRESDPVEPRTTAFGPSTTAGTWEVAARCR